MALTRLAVEASIAAESRLALGFVELKILLVLAVVLVLDSPDDEDEEEDDDEDEDEAFGRLKV